MKRFFLLLLSAAMIAGGFTTATATEPIYTHKTGQFSDICVHEYVRNIQTGINYLSNNFWFDQRWIDTQNILSMALPLRISGMVDTMWTVSRESAIYLGDDISLRMPILQQSPGDGSRSDENMIGFQIDLPGLLSIEDLSPNSVSVTLSDARIITKDGTVYPMDNANARYDSSFEDNPWGISVAFGHDHFPGSLDELEGAVYEVNIQVHHAPAYNQTSIYMGSLSNWYFDFAYFDALKEAGFDAVRLAIDWFDAIDNETLQMDAAYLAAVERVVGYLTNLDMYVIIEMHNDYTPYTPYRTFVGTHHEGAWMLDQYKPYVDERFSKSWTQIAEYFKDYDEYVMFQAQNEPTMVDYAEYGDENPFVSFEEFLALSVRRVNEMNETFVHAVRSTGGNNEKRFLLVEQYGAIANMYQAESISLPDDNRLILSVHCYFAQREQGNGQWADVKKWEKGDRAYADYVLAFIKDFTAKTGIPVMLDEVGCSTATTENIRLKATSYFYEGAKALNVPCFWWEDVRMGEDADYTFGLGYDLMSQTWMYEDLLSAIMDAVYPGK